MVCHRRFIYKLGHTVPNVWNANTKYSHCMGMIHLYLGEALEMTETLFIISY